MRSIGVPSEFRPSNPADVRFDGLIGVDDDAFEAIRSGLTEKLEQVLRKILAGAPEDDVYALWRELTAGEVAAAEEERGRPLALPPASSRWEELITDAVASSVTYPSRTSPSADGVVHCAVLLDKRTARRLPPLLDSLAAHATRPLHVWVLSPVGDGARVAGRFPEITLTWIPTRAMGRRGKHLRRLLLPALVPDAERIIVLPVPAVVTGDVAELAGLDLGGHLLAAPRRDASGFGVVNTAANRLREQPGAASELRRAALARHAFDFDAFGAEVMVLDLDRLRRERSVPEGLALADAFRLRDREVLHLLAGPDRATLPERWAVVPTRTPERGPGLRHWADPVKPWHGRLTSERELWQRHAVAP